MLPPHGFAQKRLSSAVEQNPLERKIRVRNVIELVGQIESLPTRITESAVSVLFVYIIILEWRGKLDVRTRWRVVGSMCVLFSAVFWIAEFNESQRVPDGLFNVIVGIALVCSFIALVILFIWRRASGFTVAVLLAFTFSVFLLYFSSFYWSSGSVKNFSEPLSHLDSLYFTLGTMGGGTGNLWAVSESARLIQSVQMILDFALILFTVGIVISRYSGRASASARRNDAKQEEGDLMIEVFLSEDEEAKLAELFAALGEIRARAETCNVGTKERALAFREVTAIMRQIERIVPPETGS
jgi:ABC-type multidrug transport system fused ATPase/permease subunit